jgi:hypothetical protein
MTLTFAVVTVFALLLMVVGLLLTRNVRWRPTPPAETSMRPPSRGGGQLIIGISLIVLAAVIGVLAWFWGVVALPHPVP